MLEKSVSEQGLTKQRKVVLRVILDSHKHLTANEVFTNSKELLPGISFATVYNSLRYLKEAGHISEVQFGNGANRFDRITHRHDHAFCTKCGDLTDIEIDHPAELLQLAAETSNYVPESLEFTLRGICPNCA